MRRPRSTKLWALVLVLVCTERAEAQDYPPDIEGARVETFKTVGGVDLKAWLLSPEGHQASDSRPAMVFFFGGGWVTGTPAHFERQARALADRRMVAVLADYRVLNRHGTRPDAAVRDAKSAVRWVRAHASELGIDPRRIAAGGGSAGGHLAAATATVPGFDEPGEDAGVSSAPNALVLFNPAVVIAPADGLWEVPARQSERFGGLSLFALSPFHHLKEGMPPTLVLHGSDDQVVPMRTVVAFCDRVVELGGECELVRYESAGHAFFNNDPYYGPTLRRMISFFESLGWIGS